MTSTGTELGPGKTVTIKGRCVVHEDQETKDWFYPEFAAHMSPHDPANAETFRKRLDSPLRVVFEVIPEKFITYDGIKMFMHTQGNLDESQLGEPKESDTLRLLPGDRAPRALATTRSGQIYSSVQRLHAAPSALGDVELAGARRGT